MPLISLIHSSSLTQTFTYLSFQGFHLKLSDGRDVLARIANADVNMPGYEGPSQASRQRDLEFETDTYRLLLGTVAQIPSSRPLFSRHCHRYDDGPTGEIPKDISGRALMVFDMTRGQKSIWDELDDGQRVGKLFCPLNITQIEKKGALSESVSSANQFLTQHSLLAQAATIRAAMLNLELPSAFISRWIMWRAFQPAGAALVPSQLLPAPIGGSRDFCISMFTARVEALIKNEGHVVVVVGREGEDQDPDRHQDHALVSSPRALRLAAAKHSILRFLPHMLPPEEGGGDGAEGRGFYRLVLQHDDYGIHNMSILVDDGQQVSITSVFDWESASIVPVILSEVDFLVHSRFLAANEGGQPTWRMRDSSEEPQPQWHAENQKYATHYLKVCHLARLHGQIIFLIQDLPVLEVFSSPTEMLEVS